nr:type II toxin-antitoxin system VapC family toxin [Candidatus Freyrarchaeum guaymaensis]
MPVAARAPVVVVVDASALAMVLLQEEGWERVQLTGETATLNHALVEVLNALWKAAVRGRLDEDDAKERCGALTLLARGLHVFKAEDYLERSLSIALSEKVTVYDALYIALAERLGAKLQTSDARQFEAARKYVKAELIGKPSS